MKVVEIRGNNLNAKITKTEEKKGDGEGPITILRKGEFS